MVLRHVRDWSLGAFSMHPVLIIYHAPTHVINKSMPVPEVNKMRYRLWQRRCYFRILFTAAAVCAATLLQVLPAWSKEKVEIAMILFRGKTTSENGFIDTLQKSKEFQVHFTIFDCAQDTKKLDLILKNLVPTRYRLIYVFGTTATQKLMRKTKTVPIVFNIVQRPVEAGIIRSWKDSGNNCTGASNFVPMEVVLSTLRLVRNIQTLGVMYYSKAPESVFQTADIEALQKNYGFKKIDLAIHSRETMDSTFLQMLENKPDMVIFPSDSFIMANADQIVSTLNKHKILSVAIIPEMAQEHNALMALGADYYTLGKLAAGNAIEILKGKKPYQVPVRTVDRLKIVINLRTADKLGVIFPLQLLTLAEIVH
jgi:putative ABC transport system substrate-binding protein